MRHIFTSAMVVISLLAAHLALAASPPYPTLILKNNFGEQTTNYVLGGSNQIDINFIVDSANGNGLGVRSVKSQSSYAGSGVANVFMHTTATPASGNPNPAPGYIFVQLAKVFTGGYVGGYSGFVSPPSGTPINISSGLTAGNPYVITSVGTSTAANWEALGLPLGLVPTLNQAFIATSSAAGVGTGQVQAPAASGSGIETIQVVGDPNQTLSATNGSYIISVCLAPTSGTNTALVATAPANNSVVAMRFVME